MRSPKNLGKSAASQTEDLFFFEIIASVAEVVNNQEEGGKSFFYRLTSGKRDKKG